MKISKVISNIENGKNPGPLAGYTGNYEMGEILPSPCKYICPECDNTIVSVESEFIYNVITKAEKEDRMLPSLVAVIIMKKHKVMEHNDSIFNENYFNALFNVRLNPKKNWLQMAMDIGEDNHYLLNTTNCASFRKMLMEEE